MSNRPEEIVFVTDTGEEISFQVIEQTRLGGIDYLLVSEMEGDEEEALIFKDISSPADEEAIYEMVEDERELETVAAIFSELLEGEVELS